MARRVTRKAEAIVETAWRDGPIHDPRFGTNNTLPPSWADTRFEPPKDHKCSLCGGARFWTRPDTTDGGWCCVNCHPLYCVGCHPLSSRTNYRIVSTVKAASET